MKVKLLLYLCTFFVCVLAHGQTPDLVISGGGTTQDIGYDTAVDASGNMYVVGQFQNSATFGSYTITSAGNNDIFIAKYSSSGVCQWAKRAGSTTGDVGRGISISGNSIYITGFFSGTANFNTPSTTGSNEITATGTEDMFVAKYDENGNFQWAKRGGITATQCRGEKVAVLGTEVYVVGYFNGTANFNTPSATGSNEISAADSSSDIFIVKYDENGNLQWVKRAGGFGPDFGYDVTVTATSLYITGGFWFVANFNTPSSTGTNEISSAGSTSLDIFVAKFDVSGNFQWAKRAGGNFNDYAQGIVAIGSSVYITGLFTTLANFNNPSASGSNELVGNGANNPFVAKYDENGNFQWAKRAGNSTFTGTSIGAIANSVYVTGYFEGSPANFSTPYVAGNYEISSLGTNDIFLAKYNSSGDIQWVRRGGSNAFDEAWGLAVQGTSIYVTGAYNNTANFNTPSASGSNETTTSGGYDVFIVRYGDSNALPITLAHFEGNRLNNNVELSWTTLQEFDNKGFEVEISKNGVQFEKISFVESTNSNTKKNYNLQIKNNHEAYYRLKQLDFNGSYSYSNIIFVEGSEIMIIAYPNPSNEVIRVKIDKELKGVTAIITNANGQIVETVKLSQEETNLNIKHLQKGIYFLNVLSKKRFVTKFIVN